MLTRDHTVLPAVHRLIHKWNEPYLPLRLSCRASPHSDRYSISIQLRAEGWVGLHGWLHASMVYPWTVTHRSINLSWVTLLMWSECYHLAKSPPLCCVRMWEGMFMFQCIVSSYVDENMHFYCLMSFFSASCHVDCRKWSVQNVLPMRSYASVVFAVIVNLLITSQYCIKMAKCRISKTMLHDSPGSLVLWRKRSLWNCDGITSMGGAECKWGRQQEAQLLQRNCATCSVSKFVLCFTMYGS